MVGPLYDLVDVPDSIANPPRGSVLRETYNAIMRSAAREPGTVLQACRELARRIVEKRRPAGWRPGTTTELLAHGLEVLRLEVAILTAPEARVPASSPKSLTAPLVVRLYLMSGAHSGQPDAHERACLAVSEAFGPGIPSGDVDACVRSFFESAGRIAAHNTHSSASPAYMSLVWAGLSIADDLLLGHTAWAAGSAGAMVAEDERAAEDRYDRRYQPISGDIG